MDDNDIYQQHILDHYKNPHNKGELENVTHKAKGTNPSCGDALVISLFVDHGVIKNISFDGDGCAISIAAASMLTDAMTGKTLDDARALKPENIYDMLGISISPARQKCALLAYNALQESIT